VGNRIRYRTCKVRTLALNGHFGRNAAIAMNLIREPYLGENVLLSLINLDAL
jgi:hypothetical protein